MAARSPPSAALQSDSRAIVGALRALLDDAVAAERKRYMANMGSSTPPAQAVFAQASVAHYHALDLCPDHPPGSALDRQLAMLAKCLGVATSSKGFPQC